MIYLSSLYISNDKLSFYKGMSNKNTEHRLNLFILKGVK